MGTVLDTDLGLISVTEQKTAQVLYRDSRVEGGCTTVKVQTLAAFEARIISLTPCVGSCDQDHDTVDNSTV